MAWIIKIPDGPTINSDDFLLDDLDQIEKSTGVFWSIMNPLREAKVARAFIKTAYRHAGLDPDDVDKLTMKRLKGMFDFVEDEETPLAAERPTKARKGQTHQPSSNGAQTVTSGPPALVESSA